MAESFDVIVVGAGSTGGVVASRISDEPSVSVLLLEAGPDFPDEAENPPGFMAFGHTLGAHFAGLGALVPELDWQLLSEPLPDGRRVHLRRGRLVGGTSMINVGVFVRGKPSDFDEWERLGADGWSWRDVVPYYERVEQEVPIKRYPRETWQPFAHAFADAYEEIGYRWCEDFNQPDAWDGVVGPWPMNRQNEIRLGTLPTYVRKARPRENFTVRGDSLVDRVLFDGERASGVRLADGTEYGGRLVIVCGGTLVSPAILQRSGVGPAEDLRSFDVDVRADLPVGLGMRDHPMCMFHIETPREIAQLAGPGFTVAARGPNFFSFPTAWDEEEGICNITIALNRQEPDGSVRLASLDPAVQPTIDCGFQGILERGDMEGAWATFQRLMRTDAFRGRGIHGGDSVRPYDEVVRERVGLSFHMSSTCPIGDVLDPRLRVKGVEGLMVADASVFPENIENNLNMTCYMVGERCADFALEELSGAGR